MSLLYDACVACNGKGRLDCRKCACNGCNSKGRATVKCANCKSGKVACTGCSGAGRVVVKKSFFSEKWGVCPQCAGSRQQSCPQCGGTAATTVRCDVCRGTGRLASCASCNGTLTIKCSNCGGAGKFESDWLKSLPTLSLDRLRFEMHKRQRQIQELREKLTKLEDEYGDLLQYWNETAHYTANVNWNAKDRALAPFYSARDPLDQQVYGLNQEIKVIEDAIGQKL